MNEEQYSTLIDKLNNRLDTLENGLLSLNKDLIAQIPNSYSKLKENKCEHCIISKLKKELKLNIE